MNVPLSSVLALVLSHMAEFHSNQKHLGFTVKEISNFMKQYVFPVLEQTPSNMKCFEDSLRKELENQVGRKEQITKTGLYRYSIMNLFGTVIGSNDWRENELRERGEEFSCSVCNIELEINGEFYLQNQRHYCQHCVHKL